MNTAAGPAARRSSWTGRWRSPRRPASAPAGMTTPSSCCPRSR